MGIISGFKRFFNLSLTDEKAWDHTLWNLRGSQSVSGETVTEETALTYSAVWNAITLISGTIGSLPLHLMRPDGRNQKQATDHKLYDVLHTKYNPYMTAMAGRECLAAHILAWGNGYAEKVFNGYGEIVELWPIPPNRTTPKMQDSKLMYEIKIPNGETVILPREKILHVPGVGFDGFVGYSVIAMARKSIGLGMAMETFGSHFFGQGTHPGIVVSHPNQLSADAHANLKKALTDTYSGLGQSHRLMLLQEGMKIEKVTISPEDSQFLESRQFQITDVARWFGLPPHKLKDLTKSSFNNIESEQSSYVIDCLLPWCVRFEQNYQAQLLTERERREGYYFKHILEGLLRANAKDRAEFYSKLFNIGVMTQNEIRSKEDLNPNPDPLADELFVPLNMVPISLLKEHLKKSSEASSQPQKEAPPSPSEAPPEEEPEEKKQAHVLPINPLKLIKQPESVIFGDDIIKQSSK